MITQVAIASYHMDATIACFMQPNMQFDFLTVNSRYCIVGACSPGGRQTMEDIAKAEINTVEQAAIFDGHGGREAAQYTYDHL